MRLRRDLGLLIGVLALVGLWVATPASAAGGTGGQRQHTRFHGDPAVHAGLILAAADVTHLRVRAIHRQISAGKSIQEIVIAAGVRPAAVLDRFNTGVDQLLGRQVERGRLPQSIADARAAWYKQSARLQIDQPGLTPAFPGLHELHAATIGAAAQVSAIPRRELRAGLASCKTLSELVAPKGKSGTDIVAELMAQVDRQFQVAVDAGKLTTAQRDAWRAAILDAVTSMVATPGLHVAGVACAG